ncbi:MAG: hypothetical protein FXF49_06755 [Flexistipes sinusarabici]|uniref:NADH-ubiquinone oxidoreductase 51kDa subunit iron-sulphur binding domain-containing protein n=1 Tax=Flexistipes sinusarabici TaxID=2352 RepID=A0A5D0MR77_FLESI|nr:NADH-ubiquinone oxidoreductase-F iron-sulfur binding region domain-containing protein [Flexistipes sinusarabici]TYB33349.1 MAG: hypothetical protein FXF49_06755 [Flexistipes sinusarabici]
MPVIDRYKKTFDFLKNPQRYESFCAELKTINAKNQCVTKGELNQLSVKYGLPKSAAFSIASFYGLIKIVEDAKVDDTVLRCCAPACNDNDENFSVSECAHCLGLCDNAPAAIINGKQVTITESGTKEIDKAKILNNKNEKTFLFSPEQCAYYFGRLWDLLLENPDEIISKVSEANLTGRGGAGFPMDKKLETVRNKDGEKIVICNADESEPFVFKDRAIIENNPYSVLSGLILAAHCVGSSEIVIYIRGEYTWQKQILTDTINLFKKEMDEKKLKSFDFRVISGAGAYVCGEETALINSAEGKRGNPEGKPPYPAEAGYRGRPTLLSNVETFAWIFEILDKGIVHAGKRVFSLSGDVKNSGIFESDLNISVNDILKKYGGVSGKKQGFALCGGASGFFIHPENYNLSLSELYQSEAGITSLYFSDDTNTLKDVMLYILRFFADESCGQCIPCFAGYKRIYDMLNDSSRVEQEALAIAESMSASTLCGLGKSVLTPLKSYFKLKKRNSCG